MLLLIHENVMNFIVLFLAAMGIVVKLFTWISYKSLENASNNMSVAKNRFTRRIKMKFENCYKLNLDIKNIPAFVKRYVRDYRRWGIPINHLHKSLHISAVLLAIVALAGAYFQYLNKCASEAILTTVVVGIIGELTILLFELLFDTKTIPQRVEMNLEEYLENVFSKRLSMEYDESTSKSVISDDELYEMGDAYTAASKVKIKKLRREQANEGEEEAVIREIIREFLC